MLLPALGAVPAIARAEGPNTGNPKNAAPSPSPAVLLATPDAAWRFARAHDPALRALEADARAQRAALEGLRAPPNPELEIGSRQGAGDRFGRNAELALLIDVGGLAGTPWRAREVRAETRAVEARLAQARAARRLEVATAWADAVTARAVRDLEAAAASTWNAEAELARRRREAGTLNALDLAETEAAAAQARLAARREARHAQEAEAELAITLGAQAAAWALPDRLPEPPEAPEALVPDAPDAPGSAASWGSAVRGGNRSLAAARAEAVAAERALLRARLASGPSLKAGVEADVTRGDGLVSIGPKVALELPVFSVGGAPRRAAGARADAATRRVEAEERALEARLQARGAALDEARASYAAWRDTVAPLRAQAAAEALRHYNFMLVGADRLLAARREELAAARQTAEALRAYWVARAALEELAGFSDGSDGSPMAGEPAEAP